MNPTTMEKAFDLFIEDNYPNFVIVEPYRTILKSSFFAGFNNGMTFMTFMGDSLLKKMEQEKQKREQKI